MGAYEVRMRSVEGHVLFSATDLMNYLGCPHCTFLDLHRPADALDDSDTDGEQELLKQKGIEHEQRYRDNLLAMGVQVTQIATGGELDKQVADTLRAIRRG